MERVIKSVLLIVGVGLTVQTARPHFRYGEYLDPSSTVEIFNVSIPFGVGAIMVLLHVGKVMLPAAAAIYLHRAQYVRGTFASLLFPLLVIVSVTSTLAFLDLQRGERAASEATRLKRETDLRADLAATETRLKNIGWWRPSAVVEKDITAERRRSLWGSTEECSKDTTRQQQRYCGALDRLTGELTAAREAEDDRRREKEIRAELKYVRATNTSAHPDLDFLSRALSVSLEQAGFWRTVLFAAALEAAEALFLLFGTAPAHTDRQGRKPRPSRGAHIFPKWREILQWTKRKLRRRGATSPPPPRDARAAVRAGPQNSGSARAPRPHEEVARARTQNCASSRSDAGIQRPQASGVMVMAPDGAVDAFVAECPRVPEARIPGKAMFDAYDRLHRIRGWPYLSPALFGRHLKAAIQRAGGTKVKASAQIYVGLELPAD